MPSLATSFLTTSALSSPLTNRDRTCCRRAHSPDRSACSRAAAHDLYVLTSLLLRDKTLPRSSGEGPMSTIVHYECRNLDHLRAGSRRGNGGLVIHHGSVGYCDGLHVDGAHRARGGAQTSGSRPRSSPVVLSAPELAERVGLIRATKKGHSTEGSTIWQGVSASASTRRRGSRVDPASSDVRTGVDSAPTRPAPGAASLRTSGSKPRTPRRKG